MKEIHAVIGCFYIYINIQDIYKNVMFQTYWKFQNRPLDGAKQVVAQQVTRMLCNADLEIRTLDFESQFWITCCFKVHFLKNQARHALGFAICLLQCIWGLSIGPFTLYFWVMLGCIALQMLDFKVPKNSMYRHRLL